MTRFAGNVGYSESKEVKTGVFKDVTVDRFMVGNIIQNGVRNDGNDTVNSNFSLNMRVSIVGDAYSFENFMHIQYVEYMNKKWEVLDVSIDRPRLNLSIGGIYNG